MGDSETDTTLVPLGVIAKPHGIRGELRVHLYNPDSSLLQGLEEVLLRTQEGEISVVGLKSFGRGKGFLRVQLEGADSREIAESLRGVELCVPRASLPALPEGEHYFFDLEGLDAVAEDGTVIGQVSRVVALPSVDCLRVAVDGGFVEIPMLERYFLRVNYEARQIFVSCVEELPVEPLRKPKPKRKK